MSHSPTATEESRLPSIRHVRRSSGSLSVQTLLTPSPPVSRASYYSPHSSRNRSKMTTNPYCLQVGLCRFFSQVAGMLFLVIVYRLSNWPTIIPRQSDTTASSAICCFCAIFREVRVSLWLCTDGGPPSTNSE